MTLLSIHSSVAALAITAVFVMASSVSAFSPQIQMPIIGLRSISDGQQLAGNVAGRRSFDSRLHMAGNNSTDTSTVATMTNSGDGGRTSSIQLKGSPRKNKMPTHDPSGPVVAIHSIGDFLHELENTKPNEIVIVKFHAKFCKVCARVILKYKKMAMQHRDKETPVPIKFLSIESTENMKIIQTLGVKKFPFLQIYRNRECVASFGTGPAHNFQRAVGSTVEQKLTSSEEEWEAFRNEFKTEISEGLEQLELLRLQSVLDNEHAGEEFDSSSNVGP
jgi:thiol-disulfide isomerase/thioredoxin